MPLIKISERPDAADGTNASVSFDNGGDYPITVSDPFSTKEETLLEWYFEEYLRFPFVGEVEANAAAESIARYGEALFNQVFADRDAHSLYKDMLRGGLENVSIEIAGSPEFHKLHWEAMKDPRQPDALALHATMVRKNIKPQTVQASLRAAPAINLLIVTARPGGKRDVGYRTISRPLIDGLQQAAARVQIDILRPGTYEALSKHLEKHGTGQYHVIHFDVHGSLLKHEELKKGIETGGLLYNARYGRTNIEEYDGLKAFLFLEGEKEGQADPVKASELARLLINHQVPIAILNACESGKQIGAAETSLGSHLMQAGVQMVLAMGYSVTVSAAELMMSTLYEQLFAGQKLSVAIRRARQELKNRKGRQAYFNRIIDLEDWLLPVVYQNREMELATREFTPDERKAYYERQAASFAFPKPTYGFFGRDLDILLIEKRLLSVRNILLVRGMGGAGKTTLLKHLGAWWQKTNFIDRVFYFGYDESAWTRQWIITEIAKQLFSEIEYAGFHPLGLEAQQKMLAERLRAHRHLLILDNLESITGSHLAIRNILPEEERDALRGFLVDLADGRTLVLLGSRGGEEWLAGGTFEDNVYDMPGLDAEAASLMSDRILERCGATGYRGEEDFQRLLKLLNGYPLALEVVLANLVRQTPAQVLAALEAGDVALDRGDTEKKTESILRCIDYSHSNLSPDAQGLLICLAPFTGVVNLGWMEQYTIRLREQSALAHLPFERWEEVLKEAAN
ncbi:MAG: CHAT domain-containing protein [Blastocatellia bacterium]|nr:CHAT domain-containing protein [Blastocatellia bacterium]